MGDKQRHAAFDEIRFVKVKPITNETMTMLANITTLRRPQLLCYENVNDDGFHSLIDSSLSFESLRIDCEYSQDPDVLEKHAAKKGVKVKMIELPF